MFQNSPYVNPFPSPFGISNIQVKTPEPVQPIPDGKRYLNF